MCKMQQPLVCAGWNLYSLRKNPRFYLSLTLGFLLCWLLTDKTMQISRTYLTSVQLVEPFVWCYADGNSILYAALVLMLMLSALPRMDTPASYLIFRTTRRSWLIGQIITVLIITFGYCLMILLSSMLMCIGCNVYATNRWSETATMLSFAPAGFETALTVMRKTVKLTTPWGCCAQIFGLMFQYVLLLSMLQLLFTVLKSKITGILAAILLNFVGFVLTPERFMAWLHLPTEMRYYANVLAAWLSPLQHATYTMHNFGYDLLPRLHVSYLILGGLTVLLMALAAIKMRGIIGRNGSGKTVLMKCICGFLRPTAGKISVFGKNIGTDCDFAPQTGMLIETPGFLPHETGMSNLLWLAKLGNGARCEDVAALMRLVGLDPAAKKRVSQYSLGMRQRLGIAQALLDAPELLILDEPMNGLDKNGVAEIRALLLDLRAQGKTILLASHFAQDIDALCDMVQEMTQGRIREV